MQLRVLFRRTVLSSHEQPPTACQHSSCRCLFATAQEWLAQQLTHRCHVCALQTVPTCPALYRNTFTYHTVEQAPPEFEECFQFLGGSNVRGMTLWCTIRWYACCGQQVCACLRFNVSGCLTVLRLLAVLCCADEVLQQQHKVLVYCMSGITR